jgi:uncharacterized membrane protein YkoI
MPDIINRRLLLQALALSGAGLISLRAAHASDDDDDDGGKQRRRGKDRDDDDDVIRDGGAGLQAVLANVRRAHPGRIVEIEVDSYRGLRVYEIKLLDNKGRLFEIYADARDGRILKVERE